MTDEEIRKKDLANAIETIGVFKGLLQDWQADRGELKLDTIQPVLFEGEMISMIRILNYYIEREGK